MANDEPALLDQIKRLEDGFEDIQRRVERLYTDLARGGSSEAILRRMAELTTREVSHAATHDDLLKQLQAGRSA